MEQILQKIVKDLQPIFNGFPLEGGEMILDTYHAKSTSEERARNIFDTLYNTVTGYKRRLTSLAEEVRNCYLIFMKLILCAFV